MTADDDKRRFPPQAAGLVATQDGQTLLDTIEEIAGVGTWEWMPDDERLYWSRNLWAIYGLEPGDVVPTPEYVIEHTRSEDRESLAEAVERLRRGEETGPINFRFVRADGSTRHLRSFLALVEGDRSGPARLVGSIQDLTDVRRAERETALHVALSEALAQWDSAAGGLLGLQSRFAVALNLEVATAWIAEGQILRALSSWTSEEEELGEFLQLTSELRLPMGSGLAGMAWSSQAPVALPRVTEDSRFARREAAVEAGLRGGLAVPVILSGETLVVLEFLGREEVHFDESWVRSLVGISYELGWFLSRRRGALKPPLLTPRELEVLELVAEGMSAPEIGRRLIVSPATVKTHLGHVYAKLEVPDRSAAVAKAMRLGLIE